MAHRARKPASMTRDDVLDLCTRLAGAAEDYPFGDEVAVFKVGGRMFALIMLTGSQGFVNLKCDPDLALELRARHPAPSPSSPSCPSRSASSPKSSTSSAFTLPCRRRTRVTLAADSTSIMRCCVSFGGVETAPVVCA
jgi:hypothetical protein